MKIMRTLALFITIWMSAFSIGKAQEISGPQLYQYSFQTPSGTSNLTGYYVDSNCNQVTAVKSYTITTTPTTFTALESGTLPTNATAFIGMFSAVVNEGLSGKVDGTVTSGYSPTAGAPIFPSATPFTWGRMYKLFPQSGSSIGGGGGGGPATQSGLWITQVYGVDGATVATALNPFPVSVQAGSTITVTQATGTNLHVVLDTAGNVIGHVVNDASSAQIGHVVVDAGGNVIGHVILDSGSTTAISGSVAVTGTFYPYSLGQQLAAASVPVVLTAAQITTLTPPTTITANAGTNLNTSTLALETGGNLAASKTNLDTIVTNTNKIPASPSTAGNQTAVQSAPGTPQTTTVSIQGNASGIPVPTTLSGTPSVSANAGTGNFTVVQPTGSNLHVQVDSAPTTAVTVSSLPLPSGAATAANQTAPQGTAGSPSTTVLTVQGITSGTPFHVVIDKPATTFTESVVSVGTGSTSVLAANSSRTYLQIINDSDTTVYISFSGTAVLSTGTRLNANGGNVVFTDKIPTTAIKAISSSSSKNILVTEGQ